jgi:hypothetical protein
MLGKHQTIRQTAIRKPAIKQEEIKQEAAKSDKLIPFDDDNKDFGDY